MSNMVFSWGCYLRKLMSGYIRELGIDGFINILVRLG